MNFVNLKPGAIVFVAVILFSSVFAMEPCRFDYASFGAIPDDGQDDAPALQKAMDYLMSRGGGTLEVPSGTYEIRSRVSVEGEFSHLRIKGSGQGLSAMVSLNGDGILRIVAANPDAIIEIMDLDLPPGQTDCGTALELIKPYSQPDDVDYNLLLSNLELKPVDINTCYYTHVFNLDGWKVLVDNVNTSGLYGPKFNTFEGKRKKYLANSILTIKNAYKPRIRYSNFWAAKYGIVIELTDAHEEPTIDGSVSVENANGIWITKIGDSPLSNPVWIDGCHWNNAFTGLVLKNIDKFRLVQNLLYGAWDVEDDYRDIWLINCSNGTIIDNCFWFGIKPRSNVYVGKDCKNIVICNSHFGRGVSTEAVVIEDGALNVEVKDNMYGTVYAMDEGDTFGLWEMEDTGNGVVFDKNPLHPGRNNGLKFSNAVLREGSQPLKLGNALYFDSPDSTAVAENKWSGAEGVRIHVHLKVGPESRLGRRTIMEVPRVFGLYLENEALQFKFFDRSGKKVHLEVENVALRRDWIAVLAEVDPALERAVLDVSGSGSDHRFIDNIRLKDQQRPLSISPSRSKNFIGAMDQLWIQSLHR